jgi:hypothetical protein
MKKINVVGSESRYARIAALAAAGISAGMGKIFRAPSRVPKSAVRLLGVVSITPGGNHAWCDSSEGMIRKPIGNIPNDMMAAYRNVDYRNVR